VHTFRWIAALGACFVVVGACRDEGLGPGPGAGGGTSAGGSFATGGTTAAGGAGDGSGSGGLVDNGGSNTSATGGIWGSGGITNSGGSTTSVTGWVPAADGGLGGQCIGDEAPVSAAWGVTCPLGFCEANAMLSDCDALPASVTRISVRKHDWNALVEIDFSGTHGKGCFYGAGSLVGAMAWDDVPSYCDGRSSTIVGGTYEPELTAAATPQICERGGSNGAGGSLGAGSDAGSTVVPPADCYNLFYQACLPCCPNPAPDCTDKENGYPGYSCSGDPSKNPYCTCRCYAGEWQCGC
jgi:hypothetical protein